MHISDREFTAIRLHFWRVDPFRNLDFHYSPSFQSHGSAMSSPRTGMPSAVCPT